MAKWIVIIGSAAGMLLLADFLRLAWLRYRWNKRAAQLARNVSWRHWIGQVENRISDVRNERELLREAKAIVSEQADYFHALWEKEVSVGAAVEKWLVDHARRS